MGMGTQKHGNKTDELTTTECVNRKLILNKQVFFFYYSLKKQPVKHVHLHWCYDNEGVQWKRPHIETTHTLVYVHTRPELNRISRIPYKEPVSLKSPWLRYKV